MAKKVRITEEELAEFRNGKKSNNKKVFKTIAVFFSIILNVGLIIALLVFYNKNVELEDENSKLVYDNVIYESKANQLDDLLGDKSYYYVKEKLDSYDRDIIFQIKGKGKYYYSYDCVQKIVNGSYEFWAYNKEQASDLGLKKGSCK